MKTYKVTMQEQGADGNVRTLTQIAHCESAAKVVEFYGLNQPDILSYEIEEIAL